MLFKSTIQFMDPLLCAATQYLRSPSIPHSKCSCDSYDW